MKIQIRPETPADYSEVFQIVEAAFRGQKFSDQTEHLIVERLRQSTAYIPELSLVAEGEGKLLGHILISKVEVAGEEESFPALSLAPVSVLPQYQNQGIGGQLINAAHRSAKALGYLAIVLIGHATYYPRFGYEKASKYGISFPFDSPDINCMICELQENALQNIQGEVVYPKAFFVL